MEMDIRVVTVITIVLKIRKEIEKKMEIMIEIVGVIVIKGNHLMCNVLRYQYRRHQVLTVKLFQTRQPPGGLVSPITFS